MNTQAIDTRRIWMIVFFLALANLFLFVAYFWLAKAEPISDLRMGFSEQGLVIKGNDSLGFTRFKVFNDWNSAVHYIENHYYEIPEILDVPAHPNLDAKLEGNKITWNLHNPKHNSIHTNSEEIAKNLLPYVRYNVIEASSMGFSLPLTEAKQRL